MIELVKGQRVSLTKENSNLDHLHVGLGWDVKESRGASFDLDACVLLIGTSGKVEDNRNVIFYNNLESLDGSVRHMGDNLTGNGDGDDEVVKVTLSKVPSTIQKIVFFVSIYNAKRRWQNFGQISNAFIRIVDEISGAELLRFNLTEDYSLANSVVVGELYKHNNEWKFNATGSGLDVELNGVIKKYM